MRYISSVVPIGFQHTEDGAQSITGKRLERNFPICSPSVSPSTQDAWLLFKASTAGCVASTRINSRIIRYSLCQNCSLFHSLVIVILVYQTHQAFALSRPIVLRSDQHCQSCSLPFESPHLPRRFMVGRKLVSMKSNTSTTR